MNRLDMLQRAAEIAEAMLPDPSVLADEQDMPAAVDALIAFWEREAASIGERLGEDVREHRSVPAEQTGELRELVRARMLRTLGAEVQS